MQSGERAGEAKSDRQGIILSSGGLAACPGPGAGLC